MKLIQNILNSIGIFTKESYVKGFGKRGFRFIENGFSQPDNETYYAFLVVVESDVTTTNDAGGDDLAGETLPAGTMVYGNFSALSVAAGGQLIAYRN